LSDTPLLDLRTHLLHFFDGRQYSLRVWNTCGEVVITDLPVSDDGVIFSPGNASLRAVVESNAERVNRRARTNLRRYNVHNGLDQMITLTFRGDVPGIGSIPEVMELFFRRLDRAFDSAGLTRLTPYSYVPEWGTKNGRLHLHLCVSWWDFDYLTEVCMRCATPRLRSKRSDIPRVGERICVGCIWSHGFVGAPVENSNGRALSAYLYVSKNLGSGLHNYSHSYRVALGAQPTSVQFFTKDPDEAVSLIMSQMGATFLLKTESPIMYVPPTENVGFRKVGLLNFND